LLQDVAISAAKQLLHQTQYPGLIKINGMYVSSLGWNEGSAIEVPDVVGNIQRTRICQYMEKRGPDSDEEKLAFFAEYVGQHSKTREDVKTWFEAIELDDYASFGGKA